MDIEQRRSKARAVVDAARVDVDYLLARIPEGATVARMSSAVEEARRVLTQALNALDDLYEDGEE